MTGLNVPDQPGQGGMRPMSVAVAVVLMTVGAVLVFAVTGGSPHWLNLRIVGVILILAGILGLALPRLSRGGLRRWFGAAAPGGTNYPPADDLLSAGHDPLVHDSSGDS
jgi:fatty acid desaturase